MLLTKTGLLKIYQNSVIINEAIELQENIFDFSNYTKKNKTELKEAINALSKIAEEKYIKVHNKLYKKYKDFYDYSGIPPVIIIFDCSKQKEAINLLTYLISSMQREEIKSSEVKKFIKYYSPMELTLDAEIEKDKNETLKAKFAFVIVPKNTLWNRLIGVRVYGFLTNSLLNHPLWSQIEELIFLIHELIEAEEDIVEGRGNHPTGEIYVKEKNENIAISSHHSVIVLAKEAIVLNKYKHIKALRKLREMRYLEWKAIKAITGVDLSTLTKLDKQTEKKLLKMKLSEIKEKENGKIVTKKRPTEDLDKVLNTDIKGFKSNIENLVKKFNKNISFNKSFVKSFDILKKKLKNIKIISS